MARLFFTSPSKYPWNNQLVVSGFILLALVEFLNCSAFAPPAVPRQPSFSSLRHTLELQMASTSNSKTGGRLLESAEDYSYLVTDDATAERPVLLYWTAPWCGPCRLSIPVVKEVVKLYAGKIDALEVCTDDLPDVAADAGVVSIPTIHIYFRGKLLDTLVGCVAKQVLAGSVEKVLEDIAIKQKGSAARKDTFDNMAP